MDYLRALILAMNAKGIKNDVINSLWFKIVFNFYEGGCDGKHQTSHVHHNFCQACCRSLRTHASQSWLMHKNWIQNADRFHLENAWKRSFPRQLIKIPNAWDCRYYYQSSIISTNVKETLIKSTQNSSWNLTVMQENKK